MYGSVHFCAAVRKFLYRRFTGAQTGVLEFPSLESPFTGNRILVFSANATWAGLKADFNAPICAKARVVVRYPLQIRALFSSMNCKVIKTLAALISVTVCSGAEPLLTHTDAFVSGANGYHTYRIPAV